MFIAALFTISKIWKQPKYPLLDKWIKKIWYICTMEYYTTLWKEENLPFPTMWMDLESIVCVLSRVWLCDPMDCSPPASSVGFPRQGYWSELPFAPPRDLPNPDNELTSHASPALAGGFFTTRATWETQKALCPVKKVSHGKTNTVWLHLYIKSKIVKLTEAASRMVVGRDYGRKREWGGDGQSKQNFTAGWIRSGALLSSILSISNSTVLHT